jgi:2-polyprenyl-3-methyl-5-hydroxy-6-metoxy-1,4-benzoquinol methylase
MDGIIINMKKIVDNYKFIGDSLNKDELPQGDSVSPKGMIFHLFQEKTECKKILDVGFGTGKLGELIKENPETKHWEIDGIDGWDVNCHNFKLINKNIYRNIWCGLAQEMSHENYSEYDVVCLLDVIEHLDIETAKWLLRSLFMYIREDAFIFVSTPLWFYPQDQIQKDDLEEHLIGIPASSMMALDPIMYSVNQPLVGGFIYKKTSLELIDFFQPTSQKTFTYEKGLRVAKSVSMQVNPGVLYKR